MQVLNIDQYEDGSSWAASVKLDGFIICAVLVANKLRLHQVARKDRLKANPRSFKIVQQWATDQVQQLSAEWMQLHTEMYKQEN